MADTEAAAVARLLASDEPGVVYRTRRELLGEDPTKPELQDVERRMAEGPKVAALLQFEDVFPYEKWFGSHWRLVSLVELGLTGHPAAEAACNHVLETWVNDESFETPRRVDGLIREHASVFGNALAVASKLGLAGDPRAAQIAAALCDWQWPDGGWNCDDESKGQHSSFHETLGTLWGLSEYHRATSEPRAGEAAARGGELLLAHRLFRKTSTGEVIDPRFLDIHWPPYWRYDFLQALRVLGTIEGALQDERCDEAFDLLEAKRLDDGTWRAEVKWWRPLGSKADPCGDQQPDEADPWYEPLHPDTVDWDTTADEMATFNALLARELRRNDQK